MSDLETIAKLLTEIAHKKSELNQKFQEVLILCHKAFYEPKPIKDGKVIYLGNKKAD